MRLGFAVDGLTRVPGGIEVASGQDRVRVDRLVLCPGLHADTVAKLARDGAAPRIVPFRGEYMLLKPERAGLVRGLIYPVPDPRYPFLGVHFTPRVDGSVEVGPNAVLATAREGYKLSQVSVKDLARLAAYPGAWRMAAQHWRTGVKEYRGSLSRAAFMKEAGAYVPGVGVADVVRGGAGCTRPGARSGRHARGRLPHPPGGPRHGRAQRPVPGGDRLHGHRRAHHRGRVLPGVSPPQLPVHATTACAPGDSANAPTSSSV